MKKIKANILATILTLFLLPLFAISVSAEEGATEKPFAQLKMPESASFTYSGESYSVTLLNADEFSGNIIYKYYLDRTRSQETTPKNSGALENGGAPVNVGVYYVSAIYQEDEHYKTSYSNKCTLTIKPEPVESLTVSNHQDGVECTWSHRMDADRYTFYLRRTDGTYKEIAYTADETLTTGILDLSAGKYALNMTVHQSGANGISIESDVRPVDEVIYHNKLTISNTSSGAKLKWSKNSDASGYYIYRKTKGQSKYYKVKTITKNSTVTWTDTSKKSISNGRRSYYYVRPYFKTKPDAVRDTAIVKNYFLSRPKAWASGRHLDWSTNKSATGYKVEIDEQLGMYVSYTTKKSSIYKYFWPKKASLTKGRVRAYKVVDGVYYYSAWSKTVKDKRLPKQLR